MAVDHVNKSEKNVKAYAYLNNQGEMAEWLKALVC